jgi:hypothetical protein
MSHDEPTEQALKGQIYYIWVWCMVLLCDALRATVLLIDFNTVLEPPRNPCRSEAEK